MAMAEARKVSADPTLPTRPLTLCRTGTKCTLKGDVVRTSRASVPDAGNRLSPSFDSATLLPGSTSAWIERVGCTNALGTGRFHEVLRLPSFGLSGTPTPGAG